jgi:hypothetical protein
LIYDIRPAFGTERRVPNSPTTGKPLDKPKLYTEFNERKALAQQLVTLAEIDARREYPGRLKGNVSMVTVDPVLHFGISKHWASATEHRLILSRR